MSLHSPKDQPDKKPCNPLDQPVTLGDLLNSEQRIIAAINSRSRLSARDQLRLDAITTKSASLAAAAKALGHLANMSI